MKCFKCEKDIKQLCPQTDDMPDNAVVFDGGDNYGSQLYDAMIDGIMVRLFICDDCLVKHRDLIIERRCDAQNNARRV